ncbi:MAG: hypothetical protein AAF149_03340 [Bacteroidota bacterium]
MKAITTLIFSVCLIILCGCGSGQQSAADKIAKLGEEAVAEMEEQSGDDELLPPVPNTEVDIYFDGYSEQNFQEVYRYQANITNQSMFVHVVLDNNDYDEQHIALTFDLQFNEVGEYVLDRTKNGNIYIEIDGLAFRTGESNAQVKINSISDGYIEGVFSANNVERNQSGEGSELITIKPSTFRLPLKDMRR